MDRDALTIDVADGLANVDRAEWDAVANPPGAPFDPFLSWDFLEALERARCAVPSQGWAAQHLIAKDAGGRIVGAMPLYLKGHSQGEYVFDHAWADALHRAGGRYYPKLQGCVPFTPVPGRRILATAPDVRDALAAAAVRLARETGASSTHVTFCRADEQTRLGELGYLKREGVQFHWSNAGYGSFEDFLAALSSNRRKNIRKERARACEGLKVRALEGADIDEAAWETFFRCYMDTGARKWGRPYLNRRFFDLVLERMPHRIVLFLAEDAGRPVASALNFVGSETLYGRYWGRLVDVPFLHFELCYYRAIELAIERRLPRVEAGAQGEHKLARGYAPVATHSAHWIAHPGLRGAVGDYLARERPAIADEIEELEDLTPFRKDLEAR